MDFVNGLDPASLVLLHSGVAFLLSPFTSPTYNLPVFLFGIYAQANVESFEHLRIFTGFVGFSLLLDIVWFFTNDPAMLVKLILILNWALKIPTFLSLMLALRQRGDRFGGNLPGAGNFGDLPQTVWTMPTPSGQGAYQAVGGDNGVDHHHVPGKPLPHAPSPAPAAPTMPHVAPTQQPAAGPPGPGAFTI